MNFCSYMSEQRGLKMKLVLMKLGEVTITALQAILGTVLLAIATCLVTLARGIVRFARFLTFDKEETDEDNNEWEGELK